MESATEAYLLYSVSLHSSFLPSSKRWLCFIGHGERADMKQNHHQVIGVCRSDSLVVGGDSEDSHIPPSWVGHMLMYSLRSTQPGGRPMIMCSGDVSSTQPQSVMGHVTETFSLNQYISSNNNITVTMHSVVNSQWSESARSDQNVWGHTWPEPLLRRPQLRALLHADSERQCHTHQQDLHTTQNNDVMMTITWTNADWAFGGHQSLRPSQPTK